MKAAEHTENAYDQDEIDLAYFTQSSSQKTANKCKWTFYCAPVFICTNAKQLFHWCLSDWQVIHVFLYLNIRFKYLETKVVKAELWMLR